MIEAYITDAKLLKKYCNLTECEECMFADEECQFREIPGANDQLPCCWRYPEFVGGCNE